MTGYASSEAIVTAVAKEMARQHVEANGSSEGYDWDSAPDPWWRRGWMLHARKLLFIADAAASEIHAPTVRQDAPAE